MRSHLDMQDDERDVAEDLRLDLLVFSRSKAKAKEPGKHPPLAPQAIVVMVEHDGETYEVELVARRVRK